MSDSVRKAYGADLKKYAERYKDVDEASRKATMNVGGFSKALMESGQSGLKTTTLLDDVKTGIKGLGRTALSAVGDIGTNLAISAVIQGVAYGWDQLSNKQEHAIEKGNETIDNYKSIQEQMAQTSSWIQTNGDRFATLSKGVSSLGNNLSLSNEEYAEYQQLASQVANQFPELITGYDSIGTPIIGAAKSVEQLNTALANQKIKKYNENLKDAQSVVDKFNSEVYQDKQWWFQESGIQNQIDALDKFKDVAQKVKSVQDYNYLDFSYDDANLHDALKNAGIDLKDYNSMMSEIATNGGIQNLDKDSDAYATWQAIESSKGSLQSQLDASVSSLKSYIPAFIQAKEGYQELLLDSSKSNTDNLDTIVNSMTSAFTKDDLINMGFTGEDAKKQLHAWSNEAVTALQDDDFREKLNDVFTIDEDASKKSFGQWRKDADAALDEAEKRSNDFGGAWTREQMRQASGIADKWERLRNLQTKIEEKWGKSDSLDARNNLSMSDFETLGGIASDSSFTGTYQDAIAQIKDVQEQAKLSLDSMQKVVTTATANLSTLQSATSEASSATGLTADTITSMGGIFSDIDNFDSAALFKNTANGVKLNTKALSSLLAVQHDIKANDFTRSIEEQTKAIAEQNDVVQAQTKGTDAYKTEQDKLKSMFADLSALQQAQSQYHALYKQQQELFSDYGQWQQAQSTANAGDKYNNMVSGLKTAKEAWDKGLIGTDDFKSFAKLISPSGATDDVNFAENYAKAARYLTEDESGVKAFLNDLSSKGLADFNEESQQWSYNVKDMAEAAKQMGMGKDFMSNMFGRLEDYGFHNNVISDAEDGVLKLSDAYSNLAESEARLEDLKKNDPTNTTAIEQAEKEVSGYKQDIDELGTNLKEVASHTAENYNRELETAKNQMKTLADERERILKSNEYGENTQSVADYMQSQIDQLGQNYGLDSSALQQQAEQAAKAYSDALQNATIENPVTPDFGEDTASADAYASAVDKVQQANKDNNQTLSDSIKTLQEYNSEQIKGIDLLDGAYDSDELKPAEQALDNICQSLGLTSEEAGLLGQVLESMGIIKPEVDDSDIEKAGETADTTSEKVQSLKDLQSSGDISSDIELDFDTADMSADELKSKIDELNGLKAEIDTEVNPEASEELDDLISKTETDYKIKVALDTDGQTPSELLDMAKNDEATFKAKFELDDSGYQEALSYLQDKDVEVKIKAALDSGTSLNDLLQAGENGTLQETLHIDDSQVDTAKAKLESIQNGEITVPITVKLDEGQFNSLIESLTGEAVEVPAEVETPEVPDVSGETVEYPSKVDTPDVPDVSGEEITYTATVDTPDLPDIQGGIAYYTPQVEGSADGETAEGTINYDKGTVESADGETSEGIINYDKGDVEKADGTVSTGTINYDLGTVAVPTGMVASGTINYALGTVATPGKAMGTFGQARAFAKGSLTDFPAYGDGRVSLPNDQKALVNEEYINGHSESIVRDGVWSLIPGGAHMENLKKGDIIFSAQQTEDLLKRGATPGHARAYAQGSLSDISLTHAFDGGSGWGGFGGGLSNKTSVSSGGGSSSQQSYNDNSGAVARNTDETEKNTKAKSDSTEALDWVETKLKKFSKAVEHISNQITDYISSTFKTVLLKRQVKAVEKQLKVNEQGYTAYMNKANSVDISDDYKNKVINGTFSIEEIDTSSDSGKQLAKDIKQFQEFYNSAQDCKDTVQELNNKLLELYETIVNMPTEKAEKKIERLKTKLESLNSVSDAISLGGSAIAAMQNQIKVDNPGLGNAQKKLDKAETARNATKKTRAKASRDLKSATADAESTGNTLIKTSEKQTKSIGKKLKSAAKSSTNKATYNAIAQAVREGKPVNLKGLKGSALKYAKSYNSSLKQGNTIASKVKAGKTVKTSGMSNILKSTAQAYNADAKEKASAQKVYDNAKKADEKALDDLTKAQKNKEKLYSGSTKEQQILATTKGKKSYVYQNMLLTQETKNLKEQNKQRQKALKETRDSYMKAKGNYDTADADKTKSQKKLLNNKTVMSKLNKTQQKALKVGKTVSTKGITDPKVLKWIQDYNEKVKKSADLSKKLRIEQEALDKATSEAAQSQAEYAQSIVENAKKKLENIANYYDSFTSQWENRNSMYEAYMDRMQTQGYNLSTKFYEAEIGQQQKIVDNLSQKYIAMKRNFAQAVQDGTIVEGTEEYYEMQNEIDQIAISLKEAQNKVVEFQSSIRDLKWEQFDQLQDAIGRITSESDFLIDLMSHKDMYDKDGNMTEQGLATMGLHGVNYNTYMAQADKYKEEMLKISAELANDPNNQKLIDRKNELIDAQQQAILSAEDEKDSIKDLIQDGIDKQLDALDDLIDKYLDVLDSEKD